MLATTPLTPFTRWFSRRRTAVKEDTEDDANEQENLSATEHAEKKTATLSTEDGDQDGQKSELDEEGLNSDELWAHTLGRRRHPLGFVLAPSRAYAVESTKDARWLAEQQSVMFKMWPVFLSVIIDLLVNAYTEPVYSTKRTVHALVFSCQVCSVLLTVTSFVVLVGGDSASMTQADYYLRLFSESKAMIFFCLVNVLVMCTCRILKIVLLLENYPHAEISKHVAYRFLFAAHQLVSTLYYVTLFQSVFAVCKHYCVAKAHHHHQPRVNKM